MKRETRGFLCFLFTLVFGVAVSQTEKMRSRDSSENIITLFLAGDVMTGRGIDQAMPHSVDPVLYESYVKDAKGYLQLAERNSGNIPIPLSYKYIWGDALEVWNENNPKYRLINLETSITTHSQPWKGKGIHYRMHPGNAKLLTTAGIDHCSLANNHVLDWDRAGLDETLTSLHAAGIKFSGAGENSHEAAAPSVLETENGRLLIFSYGAGNSGIPPTWAAEDERSGVNYIRGFGEDALERIKNNILAFREAGDLVIFSIHWGGNWGYHVPDDQRNFAHRLIEDAGVDMIFGHSSHHPLGIEVHNNKLILYGAGDFINDYEGISGHDQYRPELSLMYFPQFDLVNGQLKALKMVPMEINKFRLNKAGDEQAEWLANVLNREGKAFGTAVKRRIDNSLWLEW